ncbi:hypothetical protein [uncultured Microbulbifer sp.]|uniref:hypothetical protein n=1 Tax=uncultured Microbulbifer sp. TaxID=348147 RepID=UPI00261C8E9B|nr:hypothetical protein [uncultured Microbulbifer sp.]
MSFPIATAKLAVSGRYRLHAKNINTGRERLLADWFPNLITDNGLNLLTTVSDDWTYYYGILYTCALGSSNITPSNSDTTLKSLVASVNSINATQTINTTENYLSIVKGWTFPEGTAAGNLAEIGVGVDATNLFSRALIRDADGNPTTISVQSNEILTVTYELRILIPTGDGVSTVSGYNITLRSAGITSTYYWKGRRFVVQKGSPNDDAYVSANDMGDATTMPTFDTNRRATAFITDAYVDNSFSRTGRVQWDVTAGNITIKTIVFRFGCGQFQFSVDPPIVKTNEHELTVDVSLSWGREGEL